MTAITIRKLPEETKQKLRVRAAEHGRSMEAEARDILVMELNGPGAVDLAWPQPAIEIDDELMAEAQAAAQASTPTEAVARGLELLVRLERQKALRSLRGALNWDDDLDRMRTA